VTATPHSVRVSVLHWKRPVECCATVAALRAQGVAMDLTVVDNHSSPAHVAHLRGQLPTDVELLELDENVGWGAAHNRVARRWLSEEDTPYLLVSAHDALPEPGCVKKLVDAMAAHPRWGMACPDYGTAELPSFSTLRGARLRSAEARAPGTHEEVDFCHGTLALFRRDCLSDIGLYDESYFAYGDETEIGVRARRRGWAVGLVWGATVVNPGSWSGDAVIGYLWTRNSLRLAKTFGGSAAVAGRLGVVLAATLRETLRGAPAGSLSSPAARMRAIADYLRGYAGGPPPSVVALNRPRAAGR